MHGAGKSKRPLALLFPHCFHAWSGQASENPVGRPLFRSHHVNSCSKSIKLCYAAVQGPVGLKLALHVVVVSQPVPSWSEKPVCKCPELVASSPNLQKPEMCLLPSAHGLAGLRGIGFLSVFLPPQPSSCYASLPAFTLHVTQSLSPLPPCDRFPERSEACSRGRLSLSLSLQREV